LQQLKTFELLLLNVGLTFYSNPAEAQESIQELCDIYDRLFGGSEKDPKTIEVLTDLFVSWLVQPSTPVMRDTIENAFRSFCPSLTAEALDILLGVIKKEFDEGEEDEDEDEDGEIVDSSENSQISQTSQSKSIKSSQNSLSHSQSHTPSKSDPTPKKMKTIPLTTAPLPTMQERAVKKTKMTEEKTELKEMTEEKTEMKEMMAMKCQSRRWTMSRCLSWIMHWRTCLN